MHLEERVFYRMGNSNGGWKGVLDVFSFLVEDLCGHMQEIINQTDFDEEKLRNAKLIRCSQITNHPFMEIYNIYQKM